MYGQYQPPHIPGMTIYFKVIEPGQPQTRFSPEYPPEIEIKAIEAGGDTIQPDLFDFLMENHGEDFENQIIDFIQSNRRVA